MKCPAQRVNFLLFAHHFRHVFEGLDRADHPALFIPQDGGVFDDRHGAMVLVADGAALGFYAAAGKKATPIGACAFADNFAARTIQYPAGLTHQLGGRVACQLLHSGVYGDDSSCGIHHHDAVLQRIYDRLPITGQVHMRSLFGFPPEVINTC